MVQHKQHQDTRNPQPCRQKGQGRRCGLPGSLSVLLPGRLFLSRLQILETELVLFQHRLEKGSIAIEDAPVILPLPEIRQHVPVLDPSGKTIRKGAFQAVSHFNPAFPVLYRQEQQDAIVLLFIPDAPLPQHGEPILFQGLSLCARHGQHHDLGFGLPFQGRTAGADGFPGIPGQDPRQILDIDARCGAGRDPDRRSCLQRHKDHLANE